MTALPDKQPHVLVVDDDDALARVLRLILMTQGFSVTTAYDGVDALNHLSEDEFDVIVLDLQMPRMDGRTFYREIRSRGYNVPVLILSANNADAARAELDAEAALNKPFDLDTLAAAVEQLATRGR